MTLRLFAFLLLGFVFLPACKSGPKISAMEMERQLGSAVFDLNKYLNSGDGDGAKTMVAEEGEPAFDVMIQGFRDKKYNLVMSDGAGKIDYLSSSAVVQMRFFHGTYTQGPKGKEVMVQDQLWKYGIGGWKWYGPVSK